MRVAMLSPIAGRTPPRHYSPWENIVSLLTEGLVTRGFDITLFATADSETKGRLHAVCRAGYEEDKTIVSKVWECLHISELFEHADEFDLIHNNFDFLPLTYTRLVTTPVVTTIHGFPSPNILPVYKKYNKKVFYVSINNADRAPELDYIATIHYGIDLKNFNFQTSPDDHLLFFGRIHHEQGTKEAIEIARVCNQKLIIAGTIQDEAYFKQYVEPFIDNQHVMYVGSPEPIKLNKLLGCAQALLHPLNFKEPFSLSAIESMACGTPVIAFNIGSMPELIDHGENGFLVANCDEAVEAVGRIKEIDRPCCRKTIEKRFTIDCMVEKYIHIYEQILEKRKREDHRPWGFYCVLANEDTYKSKKIVVYTGKRLSLQRHQRRAEHWYILQGQAKVTLNEKHISLTTGHSVDIPRGTLHRIENTGKEDLVFIEIQMGDYFEEDDIERIEDDFGRI